MPEKHQYLPTSKITWSHNSDDQKLQTEIKKYWCIIQKQQFHVSYKCDSAYLALHNKSEV
jgi:hypothetical protein